MSAGISRYVLHIVSLSAHMNDWRQKIFDELDYLEETLRNSSRGF